MKLAISWVSTGVHHLFQWRFDFQYWIDHSVIYGPKLCKHKVSTQLILMAILWDCCHPWLNKHMFQIAEMQVKSLIRVSKIPFSQEKVFVNSKNLKNCL